MCLMNGVSDEESCSGLQSIGYFRSLGSCIEFIDLGSGLMIRRSNEEFRTVRWEFISRSPIDESV